MTKKPALEKNQGNFWNLTDRKTERRLFQVMLSVAVLTYEISAAVEEEEGEYRVKACTKEKWTKVSSPLSFSPVGTRSLSE